MVLKSDIALQTEICYKPPTGIVRELVGTLGFPVGTLGSMKILFRKGVNLKVAFTDQNLTCKDCGASFVWTGSEQEFYQQKGYTNPPARCPSCRQAKRASGGTGGGFNRGPRQMFPATCAKCGAQTEVPFQPKGDKPVYCRECFQAQRTAA